MAGTGEARHVHANLRHHDAGRQVRDPGYRRQQAGALPDRRQRVSHGRIQLGQRALQGINDLQVQPQHRAVMLGDAPAQRLAQFGRLVACRALGQRSQARGFGLTRHEGIEHRAAALAQHIRQDAAEASSLVALAASIAVAARVAQTIPNGIDSTP